MSNYTYQVSESSKADKKRFDNYEDAIELATRLSKLQSWPVFVDVYCQNNKQLASFWYTVTHGKLQKYGNDAGAL